MVALLALGLSGTAIAATTKPAKTTAAPEPARAKATAKKPAAGKKEKKVYETFGEVERLDLALDALIAPGVKLEKLAGGFEWAEGPVWDRRTQTLLFSDVPRNVVAVVEFQGLKDWQDIRGRLMNVAGIQALEVNALSARGASITFDYAGSLDRLQAALGQSGFAFDERDGTFVLRSR